MLCIHLIGREAKGLRERPTAAGFIAKDIETKLSCCCSTNLSRHTALADQLFARPIASRSLYPPSHLPFRPSPPVLAAAA